VVSVQQSENIISMMQHQPNLSGTMVSEVAVVSGANGFIGQHLCKQLAFTGVKVVAIPRDILLKPDALQIFLKRAQPDYIYHLAAFGNHSMQKDADEIITTNYAGTYALLSASKRIAYKAFINVSTSSVLLNHETFYSASKAGAERLAKAFYFEYGKPVITVRPYSIYGPGEADFRFIPTVFRSCLQGERIPLAPDSVHDWVYVQDFVEAMLDIAQQVQVTQGKALNIGTGIGTTNDEIVRLIEQITGKRSHLKTLNVLRKYDTTNWVCKDDEQKYTNRILPFTTLKEGLTQLYGYYQQTLEA
jgi:nucleoside-diphosphate-sugar epimerase